MNILEAVGERRSIRKFQDRAVPDEVVRQVLHAATLAPSGKNRQPWRFHVVQGKARAEMIRVMREAIARFEERGEGTGSAKWTVQVMEQAPITVFVYNPFAEYKRPLKSVEDMMFNIVDVQSAGAAIQNMLLAALELGLGSLWICDVFYAYDELCEWLGESHQMVAAVSLGYADESPDPRPRQPVDEVIRWVGC
jgi:nitroreductase